MELVLNVPLNLLGILNLPRDLTLASWRRSFDPLQNRFSQTMLSNKFSCALPCHSGLKTHHSSVEDSLWIQPKRCTP
jgi:hypothetical protein